MFSLRKPLLTSAFILVVALLILIAGGAPASAETWMPVATAGLGDAGNMAVTRMVVFNSGLYIGTENVGGCQVWRYEGSTLEQLVGGGAAGTPTGPGFGDSNNDMVYSMYEHMGILYVGTRNIMSGAELWGFDGFSWTQRMGQDAAGTPTGPGFGDLNNATVASMYASSSGLFFGTGNGNGCQIWVQRLGTSTFEQLVGSGPAGTPTGPGFGDPINTSARYMTDYGSSILVATYNMWGCQVWAGGLSTWNCLVGPTGILPSGFGDVNNAQVKEGCFFVDPVTGNQDLYMGTANLNGCQVWRYTGSNFFQEVGGGSFGTPTGPGFGDPNNTFIEDMEIFGGELYFSTDNPSGATLWRYDNSAFAQSVGQAATGATAPGFGYPWNVGFSSMAVFNGGLFVGTSNSTDGCELWNTATSNSWYLAEGVTDGGYETWVLVQNPNSYPVDIFLSYMTDTGIQPGPSTTLPATSRASFNVGATVTSFNVSTRVDFVGGDVICERAVYWKPSDGLPRVLGHDSIGTTTPAPTWYLAEGATDGGFETWVLVQNSNPCAVGITITYQTDGGIFTGPTDSLPANSRKSYRVNDTLVDYNVATKVTTNNPAHGIICERAMYWTPPGGAYKELGHDSIGVTAGSNNWYLPEGATEGGFETWVLVYNPGPLYADVDIKFQTGNGEVQGPVDILNGGVRKSYKVNDWVTTFDVSTRVTSSNPVVCERSVYLTTPGSGIRTIGHESIGATQDSYDWFLAEGATDGGFVTWVLVQNPNPTPVVVELRFQTSTGPQAGPTDTLPAYSRKSFRVNDYVTDYNVSTEVLSTAGNVVCERAMYWTPPGRTQPELGHDSIGFHY